MVKSAAELEAGLELSEDQISSLGDLSLKSSARARVLSLDEQNSPVAQVKRTDGFAVQGFEETPIEQELPPLTASYDEAMRVGMKKGPDGEYIPVINEDHPGCQPWGHPADLICNGGADDTSAGQTPPSPP